MATTDNKTEDNGETKPPAGEATGGEGSGNEQGKGGEQPSGIDLAEHDARVQAARAEEAKKAAEAKAAQEAAEAKAKAAEDREAKLKKQLEDIESQSLSAEERTNRRLDAIEQAAKDAAASAEARAEAAEARAAALELKLHREKVIRESGLTNASAKLVVGNTPEEITASAQFVKEREDAIRQEIEQQMRNEAAGKKAAIVPTDGAGGNDDGSVTGDPPPPTVDLAERRRLAKLRDPNEYAKAQSERKRKALESLPSNHPLRQSQRG